MVIGGGKDSLGAHIAKDLKTKYDKVFVFDLNPEEYDIKADATAPEFSDLLVAYFRMQEPNLIINFVGEISYQKLPQLTLAEFDKVWRINMLPLTNIAIALAGYHNKTNFIHIGSNSSSYPFTGMYSYCTAKSAQKMSIKIMAKELAPNIRVNMIDPGPFVPETSGMSTRQVPLTLGGVDIQEGVDMMESRIPLKRLCKVEDLIKTIDFLSKDDYMTGQVLELSGGQIL